MRSLLGLLVAGLAACAVPPPAAPPVLAEPAPFAVPVLSPSPPLPRPQPAAMEAPEPPEPGPELPAAPYLAAGAGARFPGRALLAKDGPFRLSLDGDPAGHHPGSQQALVAPLEGIVVEEHPRSLRMVLADEDVRLVLYVGREALHTVNARSAWLSPVPGRAPDPKAGVHLAPGTPVDEKGRQGTLRLVSGHVEEVRFEGWLPGEAVGAVFVPERFPTASTNGLLAEGAVITAPSGEILARLRDPFSPSAAPGFRYDATLLPGAPAGFQAVHLRRAGIEVRGLVPASAAHKKPVDQGLSLYGVGRGGGGMSDTEQALLRAGAGLYTLAGARVGVAIRATEVWVSYGSRQSKDRLVWASLYFSDLGFVDVQVRPGDLGPRP